MPKPTSANARPQRRRRVGAVLAVIGAAALLGGTAFAGTAGAAPVRAPKPPKPPARMSTVGGDRLGTPGTQVELGGGAPALPKISAKAWLVADAETGDILVAHNAHWELAPASTLKMLFADTVLPKLPKTAKHVVAPSDLAGMGAGSSLVGIQEHKSYTVKDLWLGVFLRSGNDAVHVLAAMNGGVKKTVAEMNAMAKELQAGDTHVVTPDGYDEPGQHSSAYDLTLFARQGLLNADFRQYCSTVVAQFPGDYKKGKDGKPTKTRETFQIQNTDRLLSGDYDLKRYKGIAGVKNGYTTNAGNTYTGVAQRGGRTLLVTVMAPKAGHNQVYREAASLLDWGFAAAGRTTPVGTLVPPLSEVKASASATPSPSASATRRHVDAAASASTSSAGSGGVWTAAGIALGTVVVLGAVVAVIRRRRPLPGEVTGAGSGRSGRTGRSGARSHRRR